MTRTRHQSQAIHDLDHEEEEDELMSAPVRSETGTQPTQPANTGATPAATATAPGIDGPGEWSGTLCAYYLSLTAAPIPLDDAQYVSIPNDLVTPMPLHTDHRPLP